MVPDTRYFMRDLSFLKCQQNMVDTYLELQYDVFAVSRNWLTTYKGCKMFTTGLQKAWRNGRVISVS